MEFQCRGFPDGVLKFEPYHRARLKQFLAENPGAPLKLVPILPESRKQRRFLEGGIIPLVAYYQEGMNHRSSNDRERVREWLKEEFNGELINIAGIVHKVGKSTKGHEALNAFMERVVAWLVENYQPPKEAIDPAKYKHWRDAIFPYEGSNNYIDYLISIGILN